jgi:hypothetical protein
MDPEAPDPAKGDPKMYHEQTGNKGRNLPEKILKLSKAMVILSLLLTRPLLASTIALSQSATPAGSYSASGFSICSSGNRSFKVSYNYGSNPSDSWGLNPYRMTARLYKNGNQIGSSTFQGSSAWSNQFFYSLGVSPGTYTATMQFEKRKFSGWSTVETVSTNSIVVNTTATPDFDVNGTPVPADGSPIDVCAGVIKINAAATSCETSYWIGVHETDRSWNRTFQYEWGTWFSGQAPNNISLQQLATGSASYWMYGPPNRQGSTLLGGYLDPPNNSAERYYTVEVCTIEPSWQCKVALIKINCSC